MVPDDGFNHVRIRYPDNSFSDALRQGTQLEIWNNGSWVCSTGSGEPPGIDYLFEPPGCGDQSETHTVREWLGSFHIPVDDPFFLEWQQGAMFLCESFRELEQASEIATAVLVRPMVYQRLYLDYSLQGEFLPQFRKNMEAVRQLVAGLREKVEAEP